jgi:diguanylate cyclase (GGDEF)-like protein/PAS domain S-box-containing protein
MTNALDSTLLRQLRKLGLNDQQPPDADTWRKFLLVIDQSYQAADQDRYTLERSLAISSEEMRELYQHQKTSYESRLRALFGSIQDLVWLKDPAGRYLACNPMFEHYIGATEKEIIGKTDYDLVDKELADFSTTNDKIALATGLPCRNERTVTFADDGHIAWMETIKTPMHDDSGLVIGVIGVARDVTSRKQNEDALKQTHADLVAQLHRNQALMKTANDGIHIMDILGNIVEANDAFCKMLGYSSEEMAHLNAADWDARWSAEELQQQFAEIVGKNALFETRHRRRDGTILHVEISATGVMIDGIPYLFAASRDITERKKSLAELNLRESYLTAILENQTGMVWLKDNEGYYLAVNRKFVEICNKDIREIIGKTDLDIWPKAIAEKYRSDDARVCKTGKAIRLEESGLNHGELCWFETYKSPVFNGAGEVIATTGTSHDITERRRAEDDLRIAAVTFETHEAILITDAQANIIRVNQAFTDITGYPAEDVLGKNPHVMSSGRQDKAFYIEMWQQLLHTGSWSGEIWDKRKNGQIYPKWLNITAVKNEQGEATRYVGIFSDITARKQTEEEIRNLAFYDALTKLPNRRLFLERFRAALPVSARNGNFGAVLFLDMDRFKILNDTLGHDYGDMMLIEVAARIKSCVREMDTVARLGGDEFVVLIEEISADQEEASRKVGRVAEKIRVSLVEPYELGSHQHLSSPSIGISLYRGNEESIDDLIQHADMAMYQAKHSGRNSVRFFDPVMQNRVAEHTAIANDLHHAIDRQELRLFYQIQVDVSHRPIGAEALLRWKHPQRGLLLPDQFISVAEESMLILELDNWVLNTACQQLNLWSKNKETRDLKLSVNISSKQFAHSDFVDKVANLLKIYQVNPARLKLELTGDMVSDLDGTVKKMHALKALGIRLTMDDFGGGCSSLSYLKQLPLDQLKIGQEFIQGITLNGNDALLVAGIIDLADSFQINVIAEGIKTEAQLSFLSHLDCMAYQGFLFGKPLPLDQFEAQLLNRV